MDKKQQDAKDDAEGVGNTRAILRVHDLTELACPPMPGPHPGGRAGVCSFCMEHSLARVDKSHARLAGDSWKGQMVVTLFSILLASHFLQVRAQAGL